MGQRDGTQKDPQWLRYQEGGLTVIEPDCRMVIFDLETTGVDTQDDRIIQFGALIYDGCGGVTEANIMVNPGVQIPESSTKVHGKTDADVAMCPPFSSVAEQILAVFEGADIVGHFNGRTFDDQMLAAELSRAGYDPFPFLSIDRIDVIDLVREHFSHRLENVYSLLTGGEEFDAHEAIADVKATFRILVELMGLLGLANLTEVVHKFTPANAIAGSSNLVWGVDDHEIYMTAGKYKLGGNDPRSLLEIYQTDGWYWRSNVLGPRGGKFTSWKGFIEEKVIDLFKDRPEEMVAIVASQFPPSEHYCMEFGIDFHDTGRFMQGFCPECFRTFEDENLFDEYVEAMVEMQMENEVDRLREERFENERGDGDE